MFVLVSEWQHACKNKNKTRRRHTATISSAVDEACDRGRKWKPEVLPDLGYVTQIILYYHYNNNNDNNNDNNKIIIKYLDKKYN